ncbi:MAG TPA: serine--tRNA ligase [Spirochaetia bacterium]|nr:serine--tRNA ligase [Spirochaetia bacterium]
MLDLKYIRDNLDAVKANIANRFVHADADLVVRLYDERNSLLQEIELLRKSRNENAAKMKGKLSQEERTPLIEEGKSLKEKLPEREERLKTIEIQLLEQAQKIPNMAHPQAPLGKEEKDNLEVRRWGTVPTFAFPAKDHVELGQSLDLIDFDTAARVSGTKFYYLRNEAVLLDLALARYALDTVTARGYTPTITPDIAREETVSGIGFQPRGEESNIYTLEGTGTCLIGTAEITLGGYYADQILDANQLPLRLAGLSHCFRREAGAAGQFSKGLYRVHQFTKVEMFVYCRPEQSDEIHDELLAIEEEIFQGLKIPYRVVDTCTGDLGGPAYRKYDIEAWMPGRGTGGDWGEVTSTSNCTDYQARRLGVRFRDDGRSRFVHMLNGTACATSRAMIAVLENFQQADGSVKIPEALVRYTGFDRIPARSGR